MRVVDISSIPEWAQNTKTMKTVGAWVGDKPHHFSQLVRLKPGLSANQLLDGLMNVFTTGDSNKSAPSKFEDINSLSFTWPMATDRITKIRFAESCTDDGFGQRQVRAIFEKKYYAKNDTIRLENNQQLFVRAMPKYLGPNRWEHVVTLVGNDPQRRIDTRFMAAKKTTMYLSNYQPEMSERGYSKYVFNSEKHKNYISRHRHSESWSSDFAILKDVYVKTAADALTNEKSEILKIGGYEKVLTDQYLFSRNNNLLFGLCNYTSDGKCLDTEEDGRPIPMGDGIFTQFSRYCDSINYLNLSTRTMNDVIFAVIAKTGKSIGNIITVVCNQRLFHQAGDALRADAARYSPNDSAYYVNKDGKKIVVGGTFVGYTFQGNTLMFAVDDMLTEMWPDQGYGICMDTGRDDEGVPNVSLVTFGGGKMIMGTIEGLGGLDGRTSGSIVTAVHGQQAHVIGYGGVAVLNPYSGLVMKENIRYN